MAGSLELINIQNSLSGDYSGLKDPFVSVVIIFYNTPPLFLVESIESVIAQSYQNWELLLVDDGSENESTQVALDYVNLFPGKIKYLEHPNHANKGMSASRQLGIKQAKGDFLAFLDADDKYLPEKLEKQVALFDIHPEAGMVYSNTLYWTSWYSNGENKDFSPNLGVQPFNLYYPPQLLLLYLNRKAAIPCSCSILVRSDVCRKVGGFEESFRDLYEDQVFYAKMIINSPVFAVDECWDYYRQHPDSSTAIANRLGRMYQSHIQYLNWLEEYLLSKEINDTDIWLALKRDLWLYSMFNLFGLGTRFSKVIRWSKKWIIRIEELVLPKPIRSWLWLRKL